MKKDSSIVRHNYVIQAMLSVYNGTLHGAFLQACTVEQYVVQPVVQRPVGTPGNHTLILISADLRP